VDRGVGERASAALLARKEELASAITAALYREMPELLERYGERGRRKCHEDMRYNLEHLAPAVALADPSLFARYVTWLREMLEAHGVPARDVRRSLELTGDEVRARLAGDEAAAVESALEAGLRELIGT
jgi:MerR family transcriptional regulator, light-induced transcriptional regulator